MCRHFFIPAFVMGLSVPLKKVCNKQKENWDDNDCHYCNGNSTQRHLNPVLILHDLIQIISSGVIKLFQVLWYHLTRLSGCVLHCKIERFQCFQRGIFIKGTLQFRDLLLKHSVILLGVCRPLYSPPLLRGKMMQKKAIPDSIRNSELFKAVAKHFPEGKWEIVQNEGEPPPKRFQFTIEERAYFNWFCAKYGDAVKAVDEEGRTLLHHVVWLEGVESVRLLVLQGANVNARDRSGDTPLHRILAFHYEILHEYELDEIDKQHIIRENIEVIKFLVSAGADIHVEDKSGHTPLERAKAMEDANAQLASYAGQ